MERAISQPYLRKTMGDQDRKLRHDFDLRQGLTISLIIHILFVLWFVFEGFSDLGNFPKPVVYSVTIEGGKKLGGVAQVPKHNKKEVVAPAKKIAEKKKPAEKVKVEKPKEPTPKKEVEKPKEVEPKKVVPKKQPEPKKPEPEKVVKKPEPKKLVKKPPPKKSPPKKAQKKSADGDIDKRLANAVQRYLGESSDAGGAGFGAGALGGAGMGGGVQRPPEFFAYKRLLENHIKSGWRWYESSAPLITQVQFKILPDGTLRSVELGRPSGNGEFDASALRAVRKASPVPPPPDKVYKYFQVVRMTFDPRE